MAKHRLWVQGDIALMSTHAEQRPVRVIRTLEDGHVRVVPQHRRTSALEAFQDLTDSEGVIRTLDVAEKFLIDKLN